MDAVCVGVRFALATICEQRRMLLDLVERHEKNSQPTLKPLLSARSCQAEGHSLSQWLPPAKVKLLLSGKGDKNSKGNISCYKFSFLALGYPLKLGKREADISPIGQPGFDLAFFDFWIGLTKWPQQMMLG